MVMSTEAKNYYGRLGGGAKLGDVRKLAKEIGRNHKLAMELWSTAEVLPRCLAILTLDKKLLTQEEVDRLDADIRAHDYDDRNKLIDWLLANQLSKSKATKTLLESWEHSPSSLQRRLFWYHQGRLRWMGQAPPDNTDALLDAVEARLMGEVPEVQWAMTFTAAQVGIFDASRRKRCIAIGEKTGLYRDEKVARNCTPNYLPEWIRIEVEKRS